MIKRKWTHQGTLNIAFVFPSISVYYKVLTSNKYFRGEFLFSIMKKNCITPLAVHYKKIHIHLREKVNNCIQIHSVTTKNAYLCILISIQLQFWAFLCVIRQTNEKNILSFALTFKPFTPSWNSLERIDRQYSA